MSDLVADPVGSLPNIDVAITMGNRIQGYPPSPNDAGINTLEELRRALAIVAAAPPGASPTESRYGSQLASAKFWPQMGSVFAASPTSFDVGLATASDLSVGTALTLKMDNTLTLLLLIAESAFQINRAADRDNNEIDRGEVVFFPSRRRREMKARIVSKKIGQLLPDDGNW